MAVRACDVRAGLIRLRADAGPYRAITCGICISEDFERIVWRNCADLGCLVRRKDFVMASKVLKSFHEDGVSTWRTVLSQRYKRTTKSKIFSLRCFLNTKTIPVLLIQLRV